MAIGESDIYVSVPEIRTRSSYLDRTSDLSLGEVMPRRDNPAVKFTFTLTGDEISYLESWGSRRIPV